MFIPQSTVHDILSELNSDNATLPLRTDTSPITNSTGVTLPSGAEGSYVMGPFFNNGVATSFFSLPIDQGGSGNGWVEIETILLRSVFILPSPSLEWGKAWLMIEFFW